MSLYNNAAARAMGGGLFGSLKSGIGAAIGGVASQAAGALGGGRFATTVTNMGAHMATQAATNFIDQRISSKAQRAIDLGAGVLYDGLRGDWDGAAMRLLDSGMLSSLFPKSMGGLVAQAQYWGTPTPLFGGISPQEAKRIYDQMRLHQLAKKNLFLLEVSSPLQGDVSERFNLFATDVDYSPFILTGDKHRVGGAIVDSVTGSEPVELSLTTMDDQSGFLKRWFATQYASAVSMDGTVGLPANYYVRFRIVHAFINKAAAQTAYQDIGLFRPANLDVNLSRKEDGLQELNMTFSQLDSFMRW